ncbi:MAG TPA: cell division protein FtsB [Steroidobacteraceae bacterium]|nr:cell division protein FtsB [Steroidobacteraceae bacterium]
MRWFAAALLAALLLLQYRLWLSGNGVREVLRLRAEVSSQLQQNATLAERNRELAGEVRDLKQGYAAIEERARSDLGMTAGNETFYQVVPRSPLSSASRSSSAQPPAPAASAAPALRAAAAARP